MKYIIIDKSYNFRDRKKELEEAQEITVAYKTHPFTNGKIKIWCTKFPDVYKFFVPPIKIDVLQEMLYDTKCAFLDKDIILRSDVRIIMSIEDE